MALYEYQETIPTLWETTKNFFAAHPDYLAKDNSLYFLTDQTNNFAESQFCGCHMWSNYEVGDLRFWRSKQYLDYFDFLDKAGGFFYERWGDAPVHSIAACCLTGAECIISRTLAISTTRGTTALPIGEPK
ncbi:hypothetical protein NDA15_000889 [Ustilago hordei]|nr:hypothetical protein NDA15_000889 [Ustilago hordei]